MIEHPLFCMCEMNGSINLKLHQVLLNVRTLQLNLVCVVGKLTMEEGTREQSMMITS